MKRKDKYLNHSVFSDLREVITFYDLLGFSVMSFFRGGTGSVVNFDTYIFSSVKNTLESIELTLEHGKIGDAFTLLRKYHDLSILSIYLNTYLSEKSENYTYNNIIDWVNNKKKLPENTYKTMLNYIEKYEKLKNLKVLLNKSEIYIDIRKRCNDHTHLNYLNNILINDNEFHFQKKSRYLDLFRNDLKNIFVLFFSYTFTLNERYMNSCDYIDCLDMNITPADGSEYWVSEYVQNIFSKMIEPSYPEIANFIKKQTSMDLK
ncbi:hypothetical protein MRY82_02760 [bacterium]|nr:hypothetical protein [bacterium]